MVAAGAVGTVGKPERFLRRLFQAACGNHQEKVAEGHLCRFPQLRQFPQRVPASSLCPEKLQNDPMSRITRKVDRRL